MKLIGIAGGSGSGKSTLASRLVDKYPDKIECLNLDKYKIGSTKKTDFPLVKGMVDWDNPSITRWEKLLDDIKTLQSGNPITIEIRSVLRPQELVYKRTKLRTIYPKELLIIDGYLSLWHKNLRDQYSRSYYLDTYQKDRMQRRDKFKDLIYEKEILIPAHNKYVESTKKFADFMLDASKLNAEQVFEELEKDLAKSDILKLS